MLRLLFPRLTGRPGRRAELFRWVTGQARQAHWYVAGEVPDTIDGRFAVLATIAALAVVRLERAGESGAAASVALTERFIDVMESEHRELGLGDPKLGRTVRKLVGALGRRVELWREAVDSGDWSRAASNSVYSRAEPSPEALAHSAAALHRAWTGLEASDLDAVAEGRIE